MYEDYFGLHEKPFSITPDADFLFLTDKHRSALAAIEYGVFEQSGITVITGDIGAGKTTLVRHLLSTAPYEDLSIGLVSNVQHSLGNLLQWVAIALELHTGEEELSNMQSFRRLQSHLIYEYSQGRRVVLVIDEAQNMSVQALEELRMLININADKNQLLQIVLVGQSDLLKTLKKPELAQFAQRVTAEYHLTALNLIETGNYIASRLRTAGCNNSNVFHKDAVEVIYYFSAGLPRLINTLCDFALVAAYGSDVTQVSFEIAIDAVNQKRIGGVSWDGILPQGNGQIRRRILKRNSVNLRKLIEGGKCAAKTSDARQEQVTTSPSPVLEE